MKLITVWTLFILKLTRKRKSSIRKRKVSTKTYITYEKYIQKNSVELLNSCIYIETNLSSNNVISFIKYVLAEYDLSNDDLIFYISQIKET